jgi:hypothetical protein
MRPNMTASKSAEEEHASAAGLGHDAKAYAETAKIIDELMRRWLSDLMNLFDKKGREEARVIQGELVGLEFVSDDDFRAALNKIASGKFQREELDKLATALENTATDVNATLLSLRTEHRDFLNNRYGLGFWGSVDTDVREMKRTIRENIMALALVEGEQKQVAAANQVLVQITKFNSDLARICAVIHPPVIHPSEPSEKPR